MRALLKTEKWTAHSALTQVALEGARVINDTRPGGSSKRALGDAYLAWSDKVGQTLARHVMPGADVVRVIATSAVGALLPHEGNEAIGRHLGPVVVNTVEALALLLEHIEAAPEDSEVEAAVNALHDHVEQWAVAITNVAEELGTELQSLADCVRRGEAHTEHLFLRMASGEFHRGLQTVAAEYGPRVVKVVLEMVLASPSYLTNRNRGGVTDGS